MFSEEEILEYWKKNRVFEKSVDLRQAQGKKSKNKLFTFFEGPPTANGDPGVHHVEARSFKDIILRYKAMRGFFVPRRAGWDTHGLPVEVQVEKALGLRNKKEIENYGIAAFNKKCKESVWQYKDLWERMTDRMGFWIDMKDPYITYTNSYMEALWRTVKEFSNKGLLYEDFKVLPWCARCGTALSSHELAQGYEKVKENSVYVKFPAKGWSASGGKMEENTFFLVWTTTPWTLPGNVALAVNPEINYLYAKKDGETLILAESRLSVLGEGYDVVKKVKGSELIGQKYLPLYPSSREASKDAGNIYEIFPAEFVSTEDGSGIVHIAPAFGDDDFALSKKFNLPVLSTTGQDGLMMTPGYSWDRGWFKKADPLIIEDLKARKLLFKEEPYEHDYPFCWRCKNPLMYLARKSWWVDVNKVRQDLLKNNSTVNWHPAHIKDGRFGEWLKEKKNWAFSRERYWGTPLPVWRCEDCKKTEVIGSVKELKELGKNSGNEYYIMRHGESVTNKLNITNCTLEKNHYPLTPKGRRQVEASAKALQKLKFKPDLIFASPFLRTKETAEIVAEKLGVDPKSIKLDPRLGEVHTGIFCEGDPKKYHEFYKSELEKFAKAPPEGESLNDLKKRTFAAASEIESRYSNKRILIVSHEYPSWMLWSALEGKTDEEATEVHEKRDWEFLHTAGFIKAEYNAIPRDENMVLDMHKPFVDSVLLECGGCGGVMKRVPEVCDVWFDSGAMPFASNPPGFPADYIVEAIDQTRGWFYTLLAVSTLLGKGAPYRNVMSLGHVLDAKGKKMSKSLGNIVNPMKLIEQYGADTVRWYFYTINQPGDPKAFNEADVKDASRRFFMILWNVLQFWKLYPGAKYSKKIAPKILINKWIMLRLNEVGNSITEKLEAYDIVGAARELEYFVTEDISRWYVRRIRDVMKGESKEMKETSAVLGYLLGEISKMLAPFAPFISEKIWFELGNKKSVHLEDWYFFAKASKGKPKVKLAKAEVFQDFSQRDGARLSNSPAGEYAGLEKSAAERKLLDNMTEVRRIVGLALEARQKAGIKVRQPLSKLEVKDKKLKGADKGLLELIKEEVNVKEVVFDPSMDAEVRLDVNITPELKEEGVIRDLIREIQSARKTAGLKPKDRVSATLELAKENFDVAKKNEKVLMKETNLKEIKFTASDIQKISLK